MSLRRLSAFLLWLVLMAAAATSSAQQVVRWSGRVEASATVAPGGTVEVVLDATIDPGWKLYALTQEPGGPQALVIAAAPDSALALAAPPIGPLPFIAPDSNFNIDTQSHTESATFYVPLQVPATASGRLTGALTVTYQTCTDRFCLPPATDIVRVSLTVPGTGAGATVSVESAAASTDPGTARVEDMAAATTASTLGAYLGLAALMGALSLLTPCVFPMVPITVSYFTAQAERRRGRALSLALIYLWTRWRE